MVQSIEVVVLLYVLAYHKNCQKTCNNIRVYEIKGRLLKQVDTLTSNGKFWNEIKGRRKMHHNFVTS